MFAMHVDQPLGDPARSCRSSTFCVTISRLRPRRAIRLIQLGQREMRRIGLHLLDPLAPHVVEAQHQIGIAGKGFGCCHIFHPVLLPQPACVAKGVDPAFGADPGTGQDYDVAMYCHHSPIVVTLNLFQGPLCLMSKS